MKSLFLGVLALSMSAQAAVKTRLSFQLTAEEHKDGGGWKDVKLSKYNSLLKAKGLPTFGNSITLGINDGAKYKTHLELVEKTIKLIKKDIRVIDNSFFNNAPEICYYGKPEEVIKVIEGLRDVVFHIDMYIEALRYGKTKVIIDDTQSIAVNREIRDAHMNENGNSREVLLWEKYNKKSDTVLILSNFGPEGDGTELFANEITRCK